MAFDWDKYKDLAEELRQRDNEAAKRSAISRLYYSVYWKARLFLENENPSLRVAKENSHSFVWNNDKKQGRSRSPVGRYGDTLSEYRKKADYELEIIRIEDVVEMSFQTAEKILYYLQQIQPKDSN